MNLAFTKMQALGNDYVVFDAMDLFSRGGIKLLHEWELLGPEWAKRLCDRHFGIGADGVFVVFDLKNKNLLRPPWLRRYPGIDNCDYAWSIFNSDGSLAKMCGNGLRCMSLWLKNRGYDKSRFSIATIACPVGISHESRDCIKTDMGVPVLETKDIPLSTDTISMKKGNYISQDTSVVCDGKVITFPATCLSVGNPHCIIFDPLNGHNSEPLPAKINMEYLAAIAHALQVSDLFPDSVNVEFVLVETRSRARAVVFERGAWFTLACGTGAAAVLVAGVLTDRLDRSASIALPGGILEVEWSAADNHIYISGPASEVYTGTIDTHSLGLRSEILLEVPC